MTGRPTLADAGFRPVAEAVISAGHVDLLAATLDVAPLPSSAALPILWHWAFFAAGTPTNRFGEDGHPRRGEGLRTFPRRMWVGGRVEQATGLRPGDPAVRTSRLLRSQRKAGAAGPWWLVTIGHTVRQRDVVCIEEEQDLAFLGPRRADAPPPSESVTSDGPGIWDWSHEVEPSPALLFRYSALTFNAHRIHYDRTYATSVEGHPDLVVQGPLLATLLAGMAAGRSGHPVSAVRFRAHRPLLVDTSIRLLGRAHEAGASLVAATWSGVIGTSLTARFAV